MAAQEKSLSYVQLGFHLYRHQGIFGGGTSHNMISR